MEKGIIRGDVWREFALNPSEDFQPPRWDAIISREELVEHLHKAYRRFYLRPRFLLREMARTKSPKSFSRKAVAGLKMGGGVLRRSLSARREGGLV